MSSGKSDADFTQDVEANGEFESKNAEAKTTTEDGNAVQGNGNEAQEGSADQGAKADGNTAGAEDRKLFVGGLSWETREPQMKEYFAKFSEVESCNVKLDPMTGKSRCFAFVVYKNPEDLKKCLEAGDHAINSKKVDVKKARAKPGKIFIGGLKPEMTDEQIREAFEQYGTIVEFDMPFDKLKKQRKGFGFITFEREETMKELLKKSKVAIGEHEVDMRKATPKPEMNQVPFRGGGGGGGPYGMQPGADFYGGGYGDYYGAYGGGYTDYYGNMGGWGGGGPTPGYSPYGASSGGGKMRWKGRGCQERRCTLLDQQIHLYFDLCFILFNRINFFAQQEKR